MKALIVDEPWIGLIIAGLKTWEMRKTACRIRGPIALIEKGTGLVVGVAEVVGSHRPLASREEYAEAEPRHRISPERQFKAFADGWRTPWDLRNARALAVPVPYRHPPGAVIWVNLAPDVARAVAQQVEVEPPLLPRNVEAPSEVSISADCATRQSGVAPLASNLSAQGDRRTITVTGGNLRNNHLYLPLDFFPADAIGGRRKAEAAVKSVRVCFVPGPLVESDIDGTKRILRARAYRGFFERAGVREGDTLTLTRLGRYDYRIEKQNA